MVEFLDAIAQQIGWDRYNVQGLFLLLLVVVAGGMFYLALRAVHVHDSRSKVRELAHRVAHAANERDHTGHRHHVHEVTRLEAQWEAARQEHGGSFPHWSKHKVRRRFLAKRRKSK